MIEVTIDLVPWGDDDLRNTLGKLYISLYSEDGTEGNVYQMTGRIKKREDGREVILPVSNVMEHDPSQHVLYLLAATLDKWWMEE